MKTIITNSSAKTMVVLDGRIDTTNAQQFEKDIQPLTELEHPDIEMDCEQLSYISSSGLRIFLVLQKSINKKGGSLILKNMAPTIKEVFDMTGFAAIFKIV